MFCPECREAELYYVVNTSKVPHLRTKPKSFHPKNCSYGYDAASTEIAKEYLTSLTYGQIENKLNSMMRYLCTEKNKRSESYGEDINHHPMLIKIQEPRNIRSYRVLKRKSLTAFLNEDDEAQLCVFYGKAQLKLIDKGSYGYLHVHTNGKKKFDIRIPSPNTTKIESDEEYNVVAIGEIKRREKIFRPPFKIDLLNKNCIKYQKCKND